MWPTNLKDLDALVKVRMVRLNATIQGIAAGVILGLGLFVATNWLVVKGGPVVGPNLSLLGQFFIGYRVSFVGSLIGLAYGFVLGFVVGYVTARVVQLARGSPPGEQRLTRLSARSAFKPSSFPQQHNSALAGAVIPSDAPTDELVMKCHAKFDTFLPLLEMGHGPRMSRFRQSA